MAGTKTSSDFTTIRRGIRVRHSADGVDGKITWANAVSVKIEWDDGERVTWKRAELASKGLEILYTEPDPEEMEAEALNAQAPAESPAESAPAETPAAPRVNEAPAGEPGVQPFADVGLAGPDSPAAPGEVEQAPAPAAPTADAAPATPEPTPEAGKRVRRARTTEANPGRVSAIDAAARVLQEAGTAMNCQELIGVMAAKGYWTSPGGKTPAATLYSTILREMQTKGESARFVKAARGQFAFRTQP